MEVLVEYLAKGFMVMLSVSMPCVLVAAGVGLVVGILQAVTQVQEQTIAAAPKIVLVFLSIVLLGGYFLKITTNYFYEGMNLAFKIVPKNDTFVLSQDYYKYTRPFANEMIEKENKSAGIKLLNPTSTKNNKGIKSQKYIKSKQIPANEANFIEKRKINSNK